jgi:hypothetical protein
MCEVDLDMGSEGGSGEGQKPLLHSHRHNLKSRFELLRTLGEGTYGKVKLAREKSTGELVSSKNIIDLNISENGFPALWTTGLYLSHACVVMIEET